MNPEATMNMQGTPQLRVAAMTTTHVLQSRVGMNVTQQLAHVHGEITYEAQARRLHPVWKLWSQVCEYLRPHMVY